MTFLGAEGLCVCVCVRESVCVCVCGGGGVLSYFLRNLGQNDGKLRDEKLSGKGQETGALLYGNAGGTSWCMGG